MGDENTVLDEAAARHLARRTGFGARPKDVDDVIGLTRGQAADLLLAFRPKGFKPSGPDIETARGKWIKTMIKTRVPLQEKLVLFWHDHFATGYAKVLDVKRMALQNKTLRLLCKGDMRVLVKAINKDPAMMDWLDTIRNRKFAENENYARELQELFTLGVYDLNGVPNYTQADIVQIARAFSGWRFDFDDNLVEFNDSQHDYMAQVPLRGNKTIYGTAGGFPAAQSFAQPEGETEIDQVTDIIFRHRDSDGRNTVARRTTKRLLEFFCHGGWATIDATKKAIIDDLIATSGFDVDFDVQALLRALFTHDVFFETGVPAPFGAGTPRSIKWPIDFVVSTLRMTGVKPKGRTQVIEGGSYSSLDTHLANMGQTLLDPPSVFGWDWEEAWVSSATLLARYNFARDVIMARSGGGRFKPEKLLNVALSAAPDLVDAVLEALGMADQFTALERNALIDYLGGSGATLDVLNDLELRERKLGGLFALVMQSPAYQTH
jgi:uncharacterized protein (DUF1800 family)